MEISRQTRRPLIRCNTGPGYLIGVLVPSCRMWGAILHTIYAIVLLTADGERRQWDRGLCREKPLTKTMPNADESAIAAGVFSVCRARLDIQCVAWMPPGTALAIPPEKCETANLVSRSEAEFFVFSPRGWTSWWWRKTVARYLIFRTLSNSWENCKYIDFIHRWITS